MKKIFLVLTICILSLTGCSNSENVDDVVSLEEYESAIKEINELKSQLSSMENNIETNGENTNDTIQNQEEISYEKKLIGEFSFNFDENNSISLSVYKDGIGNYYLNGCGIYEEENSGLLQSDHSFISGLFSSALSPKEVEMNYLIGEDEYLYLVLDGNVISDVELDEYTAPMKYVDNGKLEERQNQLIDFFNSIINN